MATYESVSSKGLWNIFQRLPCRTSRPKIQATSELVRPLLAGHVACLWASLNPLRPRRLDSESQRRTMWKTSRWACVCEEYRVSERKAGEGRRGGRMLTSVFYEGRTEMLRTRSLGREGKGSLEAIIAFHAVAAYSISTSGMSSPIRIYRRSMSSTSCGIARESEVG